MAKKKNKTETIHIMSGFEATVMPRSDYSHRQACGFFATNL